MSDWAALPAGPIGYGLCAAAFILTAIVGALSRLEGTRKAAFVTASALSALWGGAEAFSGHHEVASFLEVLRTLGWIAFVAAVLNINRAAVARWRWATVRLASLIILAVAAGVAALVWLGVSLASAAVYLQMLLSVVGLLMLENVYRNCDAESRWGVKYICLGLGAVFVYDFYYYAEWALTLRFDPALDAARGFVAVLAAPFLLLALRRSKSWRQDISISRQVAFHSAVLLACGAYLVAMSVAGTLLRSIGGGWGPVLQAIFLVAAVLAMLAAFSSATVRGTLRVLVSKHFFQHKYDYRQVWLSFIQRISSDDGGGDLHRRTLQAVAEIFDCPAGALWVFQAEDGAYFPTAVWNFGRNLPVVGADNALVKYLEEKVWVVELAEFKRSPARYEGLELPAWLLDHPRAWIIVPLIHRRRLQAFLILGTPRTPATLGWEEFDLMKTVGAQAASYLAEEGTSRALADARRLSDFNQRFAFVIHDIKNVVSQMSLMTANAEKHGDDPEFQRDMLVTVNSSAERLRKMLAQLGGRGRATPTENGPLDLVPLLSRRAEHWRLNYDHLAVLGLVGEVIVQANAEALTSVLDHLIQNAIEASPRDGTVELALSRESDEAVIAVRDRGPGMDAEFIRTQLFRPLDTWKAHGMGLGAFQARELVRAMGGRLEVDSTPGDGTTMRIRLRLQGAAAQEGPKEESLA